jgi:hypothetical protein
MPPECLERQVSDRRALREKDRVGSAGRTREEVARRWFEEEAKMDIWAMGGECLPMLLLYLPLKLRWQGVTGAAYATQ